MAVTLKDIAEVCGVNVSTVSRALRGDPRVKEVTCEHICSVARDMGYQPNLAARNLVAGKTNTIWFVLNNFTNSIERDPAQYVSEFLHEEGYDLFTALYHDSPGIFDRLIRRLEQRLTDGAFLIPHGWEKLDSLRPLVERRYPLVCIDRKIDGFDIPVVTTDNGEAARELVRHCFAAGCRDFVIDFTEKNSAGSARYIAAVEEVKKLGGHWTKELRGLSGTGPIGILSSAQSWIVDLVRNNREHVEGREIYFGVFDYWIGEPYPGKTCFVAIQDFRGIARQATELILKLIDDPFAKKELVTKVPILKYFTVTENGSEQC